MKKAIIISIILVVLTTIYFIFTGPTLKEKIAEAKEYTSYKLVGDMELLENDELKSYEVTVLYKDDQFKYYQVKLYDKNINQSQIIIKNKDGVFVMTPTLNQIFKFQSDWPNNSDKPYIYASMLKYLEEGKVKKVDKGYSVKAKCKYVYDDRIKKQELLFDKDLKPLYITCLDNDEREIVTLKVKSFKANISLTNKQFNPDYILEKTRNNETVSSHEDVLYPLSMMGALLESETVSKIQGDKHHILRFTGDKNYTMVQTGSDSDVVRVNNVDGEVIDLMDGFAYYKKGNMMMVQSGMMCQLYSQDLSKDEMLSIMTSLQSLATK